jgi:hypothetical protein
VPLAGGQVAGADHLTLNRLWLVGAEDSVNRVMISVTYDLTNVETNLPLTSAGLGACWRRPLWENVPFVVNCARNLTSLPFRSWPKTVDATL